jgi:O-antigen/teichoic acid export membrane protein
MTVTNVVGPIMVYADRFLIAAVLSVSATAYYITPYTVVTKACILASAMTGVFFPAFAQFYNRDKQRVIELFSANLKLVFAVMFPLMLLVIIFGEKAISIWLGPDFAKESTIVLQWLAVGVLLNSAASVPFSFLHGIGKPDITAKLHLAELPLYLFILLICLKYYGIKGAALAWTARIVLDTALMFILTSRQYPELKSTIYNSTIYISLGTIILLLGFTVNSLSIKLIFFLLSILLFAVLMWLVFMSREEKIFIRKYFKYVSIKAA